MSGSPNQAVTTGLIGLGVDEAEARRAAAAVELNSNSFQAYKIAMTLPAAGMGAAAESERSTFVRGTIDIGDLQHYVWKSPSGTSFGLHINTTVNGNRLILNDVHIMPASGPVMDTVRELGSPGVRQLGNDMAGYFGNQITEIELRQAFVRAGVKKNGKPKRSAPAFTS